MAGPAMKACQCAAFMKEEGEYQQFKLDRQEEMEGDFYRHSWRWHTIWEPDHGHVGVLAPEPIRVLNTCADGDSPMSAKMDKLIHLDKQYLFRLSGCINLRVISGHRAQAKSLEAAVS